MLRSVIEDSKRNQSNVRIVWLDLENAFGSVPHEKIWEMMHQLGVPANFHDICKEMYTNSTHKVRSKGHKARLSFEPSVIQSSTGRNHTPDRKQ